MNDNAIYIEDELYKLITQCQATYRGTRNSEKNYGFYYYFFKIRRMLGYSLGCGTLDETFEFICSRKNRLKRISKAWSAKFTRYIKGSLEAKKSLKNDITITNQTLANSLSLIDFIILVNLADDLISDDDILSLIRNNKLKQFIKKGLKDEY
ncbi:hypothetical protein MHK_004041 [Candidatus Magnetomorum sp. HK-1]|nr:hypothetical protein MHK_004041 [Candidatus Magnetomorum sp. HK-1]